MKRSIAILASLSCQLLHAVETPWRSALYPVEWKPPEQISGMAQMTAGASGAANRFLHDYSYAGYRNGEAIATVTGPIIVPNAGTHPFDASGVQDSTAAIQQAIDSAAAQAASTGSIVIVQLPAGTFTVRNTATAVSPTTTDDATVAALRIRGSNIILRGTRINNLNATKIVDRSPYMRGRSTIQVGIDRPNITYASTKLSIDATGPTMQVTLEAAPRWQVGSRVLLLSDMGAAAVAELGMTSVWGGFLTGMQPSVGSPRVIRTITAIQGNTVHLDAPTRWQLLRRDNARMQDCFPMTHNVAVEDLDIGAAEDPRTTGWGETDVDVVGTPAYESAGATALRFTRVDNGWVRRVNSFKPDGNAAAHIRSNGINTLNSRRVTIEDCVLKLSQYGGGGGNGYMLTMQASNDILARRVDISYCRHPISITHMESSGNVVTACRTAYSGRQTAGTGTTSGSGSDHHQKLSHANLIDLNTVNQDYYEAIYRAWGGSPQHGLTASMCTFWNTTGEGYRFSQPYAVRSEQFGWGYVIGTSGASNAVRNDNDPRCLPQDHVEGVGAGTALVPASLYLDQRQRRMVTVSVNQQTIYEPNAAGASSTGGIATFTFTRHRDPGDPAVLPDISVPYTLSGSAVLQGRESAGNAKDCDTTLPANGFISFTGNALTRTYTVTTYTSTSYTDASTPGKDALVEGDETVTVSLGGSPLVAPYSRASVVIKDANAVPPVVSVSASDANAAEPGSDTGTWTISRTGALGQALTVSLSASGATTDVRPLPTTVTIPAGSAMATVTAIPIDDAESEANESVTLALVAGAGYQLGSGSSASISVKDNDAVQILAAVADASGSEPGTDTAKLRLTRLGSLNPAVTVLVQIGGTATAGTDYRALAGTYTLAAGSASLDITVAPLDDSAVEPDETVTLTVLPGAGYGVGVTPTAGVTIKDNETPVVMIQAIDAVAAEPGKDTAVFRIWRSGSLAGSLSVPVTVSGSATPGSDCNTIAASVSIGAGKAETLLTITPTNDTVVESAEVLTINLGAGTGYGLGAQTSASVTIHDNDNTGLPLVSITASDGTAKEGADTGAFTVTRSPAVGSLTVGMISSGTSVPGSDHAVLPASVVFADGQATATVAVTALQDAFSEAAETVVATVGGSASYRIDSSKAQATVSVLDDDGVVLSISAGDSTAKEPGTDTGRFTVSRVSGNLATSVTANLVYAGTAVAGSDYAAIGGIVTLAANASSASITVTALDDALAEADETVIATLLPGTGYAIGTASATVTIADNETPVLGIAVIDGVLTEPSSDTAKLRVSRLAGDKAVALNVPWALSGTAVAGSDYLAPAATVSLAAGSLYKDITIAGLDDTAVEAIETLAATLQGGPGYILSTSITGIVEVRDNEPAQVSISVAPAAVDEWDTERALVYTVSRLGSVAADLTVPLVSTGTATPGVDLTHPGASVKVLKGTNAASVSLRPIDDNAVEGNETLTLTPGIGSGYTPGAGATGTIIDGPPSGGG